LWFFYCVFPLLLFVLKKIRPEGKLLMAFGVLVWAVTQVVLTTLYNSGFYAGYPSWSHDLIYFFPLSNFCSFFMGICGAYLVTTLDFKAKPEGGTSLLLSVVIFLSLGLLVQFDAEIERHLGFNLASGAGIYAPVFLILILHLTLSRNVFLRLLSWSAFAILGEISYALYILQQPMETLYKYLMPTKLNGSPGMNFLLYFVFLLLVAWIVTLLETTIVRRVRSAHHQRM
jgi:peptidoglycan/LPS O-acetylase OafA/YrhL